MASCITNAAYKAAAEAQGDAEIEAAKTNALISAGVLAANIAMRSTIAGQQQAIRDRQINIAETMRGQAKKFWELDKVILAEACGAPVPKAQFQKYADLFQGFVEPVQCGAVVDPCLSVNPCFDAEAKNVLRKHEVDQANFALAYAENRRQALDDRRWSRKSKALQLFRGQYSGPDKSLVHAGALAGSMGAALGGIVTAALGVAGYVSNVTPPSSIGQGRREYSWGGDTPTATVTEPIVVARPVVPTTIGAPTGQQPSYVPTGPYDGRMPKDAELNANSVPVQSDGTTPLNPFWSEANNFATEYAPYRTK